MPPVALSYTAVETVTAPVVAWIANTLPSPDVFKV